MKKKSRTVDRDDALCQAIGAGMDTSNRHLVAHRALDALASELKLLGDYCEYTSGADDEFAQMALERLGVVLLDMSARASGALALADACAEIDAPGPGGSESPIPNARGGVS